MISTACYRLLVFACCLGWTVTAWAAYESPDLIALPWAQIAVGSILALWGGLTRTADRALVAATKAEPFRLGQELTKDVLMSAGAGFCTYAWGAFSEWGAWQTAGALWAAGYLGALLPAEALKAKIALVNKAVNGPSEK